MADKKLITNIDLQDSKHDKERLKGDQGTLDLPDVQDIPGQEHIKPPALREFADTTISSDDEEGKDVLEQNTSNSDIDPEERRLIDQAFEPGDSEDEPVGALALDDRDDEGEQLNEKGLDKDLFGEDLDSPLTSEEEEEDEEA